MKTLVFSDTHLTDVFEPALYNYLVALIAKVDRVILNGDFFEGYIISFDEFVASEWQKLFPLLKEKNTIYIYGNHDTAEMLNEKVAQFTAKQALEHKMKLGDREITIMHGHTLAPEFDATFPRITTRFRHYYPTFYNLHRSQSLAGRFYSYAKGFHYRSMMRKLRAYAHTKIGENELLLTGHSHQMIDDRERGFINLGAFQQGIACYAILDDETGSIELEKESYEELAEN